MLKTSLLVFVLMVLTGIKPNTVYQSKSNNNADPATASIMPANPLIEKDQNGQYLNFNIVIKNTSKHTLYLATIEASAMDASVKSVFKQSININGQTAGIRFVGNTTLRPGESIDIFNPFYTLSPDVKITFLQFAFFFDYADSPMQKENNKKRLSTDFDVSVKKLITPRVFVPKTDLTVPLKGRLTVLATYNLSPVSKADRYGLDLAGVDESGNMYNADAFKKENWYIFGKPVFAPAGGIVVDVQNDIADNEFNGKTVKSANIPNNTDPLGWGNYIIIDHGNGEFSVLTHLEKGSIIVRNSMLLKPGQLIGKIGFSGNITFPRLHYAVMNNAKPTAAEGIPAYFSNYKVFRGNSVLTIKKGRVGSGDIIESGK